MKKEDIEIGKCYFLRYYESESNNWIIYITGWKGDRIKGWFMNLSNKAQWEETTLGSVGDVTKFRLATEEEIEQLREHIKEKGGVVPATECSDYQIY